MRKPSRALIPLLCVALAVACSGDGVGLEPQPQDQRVLAAISVTPWSTGLFPDYTRQLTIQAWDQFGEKISEPFEGAWASRTTFSSSAPEIAAAGSSGLVTGRAPGTAEITATLALGGITRTASMITEVWEQESFSGVYDLTAPVTQDGGWGYLDSRYTAVLTLRQDFNDPSRLEGTYEGLQLVNPDGVPWGDAIGGPVSGSIKLSGEVGIVLYLPGTDAVFGSWYGMGMLAPGQIAGTWSNDGTIGTFTAVRREQNAEDN